MHPVNHLLGQGNKLNYVLSHADSTYDMRMTDGANTARHPANQYLLLDSADRLAISAIPAVNSIPTVAPEDVTLQPWNDFQMQRPQSLMEAFAKRIAVSEIRMPYYIPNVNSYNNGFSIYTQNSSAGIPRLSVSRSVTPNVIPQTVFDMGLSLPAGAFNTGARVVGTSTPVTTNVWDGVVAAWDSTTGLLGVIDIDDISGVFPATSAWYITQPEAVGTLITIPIGFYTPSALVTAVQAQLTAFYTRGNFNDPFVFSYDPATYRYSLKMTTNTTGVNYAALGYSNTNISQAYLGVYNNWLAQANFFNLIGFPFGYNNVKFFASPAYGSSYPLTGNPTETLYTEFLDITSSKAHEFTNIRDGNSGNTSTVALCRLYINDNVNINESPWIGQAPIIIHRQFKNPKFIRFNAESVISGLDIQVRDSFGNLVPLPPALSVPTNPVVNVAQTYPDFCITLLCSED